MRRSITVGALAVVFVLACSVAGMDKVALGATKSQPEPLPSFCGGSLSARDSLVDDE